MKNASICRFIFIYDSIFYNFFWFVRNEKIEKKIYSLPLEFIFQKVEK